jgi:hypothetical protein
MINDIRNAKPRRAGRGFARSSWYWIVFSHYHIGLAGANSSLPFLPIAVDCARLGAALFWGELQ